MDKATQKSIEWQEANHPMAIGGDAFADMVTAYNVNPAYVAGYHEAQKDLALTVEDLELLHTFLDAVKNNKHGCFTFTRLSDEQYQEVLRRFLEQREKI